MSCEQEKTNAAPTMPPTRAPRASITHLPPLAAPPATVLEWLGTRFPKVGKETWARRMQEGLVTDGQGRPLTAAEPYRAHLAVSYFRELEHEAVPAEPPAVLFVDEHLVVVDKAPFVPVVPAGGFVRSCLLYRLEAALGSTGLAPVHRLDRATSGLVLFSRRVEERGAYGGLFATRRVERVYEALARVPEPPAERVVQAASRIAPGEPFFRMREVAGEPNAWTRIELLGLRHGIGRFELRPESGKKHQLRLHMAGLGWPIVGDRLYPELLPEAPDDPAEPLRLVAKRLVFRDPFTGGERRFESRLRP